jgi:hypothetical protein
MAIATGTMCRTTTTSARCGSENHHPLFTPAQAGFNFPQMYRAYMACRRNKRNKPDALDFERNYEENLLTLAEELREQRYQPSTSTLFYTDKPKRREVFAAAFRDRIVHHLVYNELSPVWEPAFIYHSFACRPGKGTHAAALALQHFLRQATCNGKHPAHFLKLDIHNFFMTIDRRRLFDMLPARCHDPDLLWLLRVIVFHDPTTDYVLQDRENLRHGLPPHKSLFNAPPFCGLPIGNLTSQFFANVYLNALDQFVKHQLKCRYYLRYVDDLVLVDREIGKLQEWQDAITNFVGERLALAINARATRLAPVAGGVDFAGFVVRHNYALVRRRVVGNLKAKLRQARRHLVFWTPDYLIYRFHPATLASCLAAVNSYFGHFKHAQSRRLVKKLWQEFDFLQHFFALSGNKLVRIDQPLRRKIVLKQQVRWLQRKFDGAICLIQIGCYYETFGARAQKLAEALRLSLRKNWRGFALSCGFPRQLLPKMSPGFKKLQTPVVIVRETGRELYKTKERLPDLILVHQMRECSTPAAR